MRLSVILIATLLVLHSLKYSITIIEVNKLIKVFHMSFPVFGLRLAKMRLHHKLRIYSLGEGGGVIHAFRQPTCTFKTLQIKASDSCLINFKARHATQVFNSQKCLEWISNQLTLNITANVGIPSRIFCSCALDKAVVTLSDVLSMV